MSDFWQWPEEPEDFDQIVKDMLDIPCPYENKKPPFCYPGTSLDPAVIMRLAPIIAKQINAIGSHTHIEFDEYDEEMEYRDGEGGFEKIQKLEAKAIWRIASILGGNPATIDGYFCGGGTEANQEGLWIGREYLEQFSDPHDKGIVVITSSLMHYSIAKAVEMLRMGRHQWFRCTKCKHDHIFADGGDGINLVGMNQKGEISLQELENTFIKKYDDKYRKFLIVPTVGTCITGSIDPIAQIGEFIREKEISTDAYFYMHVDASFAGLTVPFLNETYKCFFQIPEVMSITVDADKMGQMPYPAGIFLCRKDLMKLVARRVNYVRGHEDDTVCGSRTAFAAIMMNYLIGSNGKKGQREYVNRCLEHRDYLVDQIKKDPDLTWINVLPCPKLVNFAPMEINFPTKAVFSTEASDNEKHSKSRDGIPRIIREFPSKRDRVPKKILENPELKQMLGMLAPYHLRFDYFPSDPANVKSCPLMVYKICIMPHHNKENIDVFLKDLKKAYFLWKKAWDL